MWEFIPESVMLKNIYYLECRNRLKNPRYQNKSIKRNWPCYNDFQVSKTSIAQMWDINAQMQRQRKDCTLDVRIIPVSVMVKNIYYLECRNRLQNPDTKIKVSRGTDNAITTSKCLKHLLDGFEHQCTNAKAKKRLYTRCENSSQNLWCSKTSTN